MTIRISSKFRRSYAKLPKCIKDKARQREIIFRSNPFNSSLNTHKLHGKYKNYWAFSVVGQYRIMFAFVGSDVVDFINIGTHEIYK
ncbi:MAG: type II toxin-antitoxin system mRNA interferase toxin, RelE/StbE family [Patescibacteria group bacterium]